MACALDKTKVLIFSGFSKYVCYYSDKNEANIFDIEKKDGERIEMVKNPIMFYNNSDNFFVVQNGFV